MSIVDKPATGGMSRLHAAAFSHFAFATTIFLSALLLFGVQPMFTKMVLPALGGSPAVWSVAMVFFQALLLGGYLYAHLSSRWLKPSQAILLHLALCVAALAMQPLAVSGAFGAPPDGDASLWLVAVFAASVGLPFFVLSATAPLLQSWFARSAPAANPYSLYVASNLGSFVALLGYPLLVEPLLPLKAQTAGWMALFALLGAALLACGLLSLRGAPEAAAAGKAEEAPPLTWPQRARWIGLAAVPSGLLVAVTAHLSTDVASAPLLWVLPLALFMLTFVLAFRDAPPLSQDALDTSLARLTPFVVLSIVGFSLPLVVQFAMHLGFLFIAAMICHGTLYRLRPPPARLTEFYLWMSFGGMLGGLFAGLLAPQVFSTIIEYRLLVVAALLCAPAIGERVPAARQWLIAAVVLAFGASLFLAAPQSTRWDRGLPFIACLLAATAILSVVIFNRRYGPIASAAAAAGAFLALAPVAGAKPEAVVRSFFGVNYVRTSADGQVRFLTHGSTYHGYHRLADLEGRPMTGRPLTMAYYHSEGGIALALEAARAAREGALPDVAVLGLGAGSMACLARPQESWTFFEIDPEVVKLARRADLFPFLSSCTPEARVVLGDARLKIQAETARYDAIVLDAFSSDAVPAHLLTREAFAAYASRLKPGGVIVAHVSNRYMDLASVAAAAGMAEGMAVLKAHIPVDPEQRKTQMEKAEPTTVVVMTADPRSLAAFRANAGWVKPDAEAKDALWTDDYANIVGAIWRFWWGGGR